MKNILLISPIYQGPNVSKSNTPVVHYFAKEWVKLGYNVRVAFCPSNFPTPLLWFAKLFHSQLESKLNISIRTDKLQECEYEIDGVFVARFPLSKVIPHARYSKKQITSTVEKIINWCNGEDFVPDVIIGHWTNPSLDILPILKVHYGVPVCMVMHDSGSNIQSIYNEDYKERLIDIDIIGYRSDAIRRAFEAKYGRKEKYIYCYSGVPDSFVNVTTYHRTFDKISNFIFVGMMISRKYPLAILDALQQSTITNYNVTYIGDGVYVQKIGAIMKGDNELNNRVHLLGRIDRNDIVKHLIQSDVFVMISKNETFGLVYLEAMAMGCITIASKGEGFDGIICDGYNGFLCEAGSVEDLTRILDRINSMSSKELQRISRNAVQTAKLFTDKKVAKKYIEDIVNFIK